MCYIIICIGYTTYVCKICAFLNDTSGLPFQKSCVNPWGGDPLTYTILKQ